jgi:hypothetical protein
MARVNDYTFGRIVIAGREEHADVILLPAARLRTGGAGPVTN